MQVVILAGGLGTRLRPLTYEIPKPMVPVKGRPFLEHQIKMLKKNGLSDFVLCVGYLGDKIKKYFKNGESLGINILYSEEKIPLGTGGALKNAKDLLEKEFLLVYGDSFLDIDYNNLTLFFSQKGRLGITVAFANSPKIAPNNTELNDNGEIVSYNKKEEGRANCVEAGVHIFNKGILDLIPSDKTFSLEESLLPILIQKKELAGYLTSQRYYDIGTFERISNFKRIL